MSAMQTDEISIVPLPAGFERWDELLGLIRRSFAPMDGVIDPPSSAHRLTSLSLEAKAREETAFLATVADRLAGCVFLADNGSHLYLGKLAIDPAFQGQGVGRRLVEAAEDHARELGRTAVELQTRIELTANHAVFGRLGFRETARTAHPGYRRPTTITMRKELG
ncbi:N-acetyltransferase [Mesorhizobium sp. L-8-10]|nr:N-acetyltransferase [Mesorhizobium sp. L-8-10]